MVREKPIHLLPRFIFSLVLLFTLLLSSACKKNEVAVYTVPKEPYQTVEAAYAEISTPRWQVPPHWVSVPASGFREAAWQVPGKGTRKAEMTIVKLAGESGSLLGNINRWRNQADLPPLDATELGGYIGTLQVGVHKVSVVDIQKNDSQKNKYSKRILGAIVSPEEGLTWFFKLTGDKETVGLAKNDFQRLIENVKF